MAELVDGDLHSRGFSAKTGYYLACASRCAYEESADWIDRLGLRDRIASFSCGNLHGFVARLDKAVVLAFRGTQNVGNCLTDADTLLVSRPPYPGRVHCGFADAVEHVWPQIRDLLGPPAHAGGSLVDRSQPRRCDGHAGLGSPANERYRVRAVYTYGSPRPGDRSFHAAYCLSNYRFVNNDDIVPHLPFRWCYKHVGKLKLVDGEGDVAEEQACWEAKKQLLSGKAKRVQRAHRHADGLLHALCDFDWLADHHLDKYLDAIRKILPQVPHRSSLEHTFASVSRGPGHFASVRSGVAASAARSGECRAKIADFRIRSHRGIQQSAAQIASGFRFPPRRGVAGKTTGTAERLGDLETAGGQRPAGDSGER